MTAVLNVNIGARHGACSAGHHDSPECEPINIPCPIPSTFEVTVRIGECIGTPENALCATVPGFEMHVSACPVRPIRVTCSISGETWEDSEVADCAVRVRLPAPYEQSLDAATAACRDRWALVRALVTGVALANYSGWCGPSLTPIREMFAQRDAVFSAICEMWRAEKAAHAAFLTLPMDLREDTIIAKQCSPVAADPDDGGVDQPSAKILAVYVKRLIEHVGNL